MSILNNEQILAELYQKKVSNFGCKIGGNMGHVTLLINIPFPGFLKGQGQNFSSE